MRRFLIAAASVVCLVYKAWKLPALYRGKYLLVVFMILAIVIGNGIYVFWDKMVDGTMVSFGISGGIAYYYVAVYVQKELLNRTLSLVVQEMTDAVRELYL